MEKPSKSAEDLAALDRILLRITGTANENLPAVISSLVPKLLPLGNDETLRRKVIEITTEIIRRVKLGLIKLPLRVFTEVLDSSHLPFAPNIAVGLLDAISSVNCIIDADVASVAKICVAALSHGHLTFLSNSLLYYALQYSDLLPAVLLSLSPDQRKAVESLLGDYFIDVLLLRDLQLDANGVGSIPSGLAEKRKSRFTLKKRFLEAISLPTLKLKTLQYFLEILPDSSRVDIAVAAAVIAKVDADNSISLKGIFLLNTINDKASQLWSTDAALTQSLLELLFIHRGTSGSGLLGIERTAFSPEVIATLLKEFARNWPTITASDHIHAPPRLLFMSLLHKYAKREVGGLSSDNSDRITALLSELICADDTIFVSSDDQNPSAPTIIALAVDAIWSQLHTFTSSSSALVNNSAAHNGPQSVRTMTYKLLDSLVRHRVPAVIDDPALIIELLKLADVDELSAGTPLHKVLQDLRELDRVTSLDPTHRDLLQQQLDRLSRSKRAGSRLLYLQWTKHLFGVTTAFLTSLIVFSGDENELVTNYISRQYLDIEGDVVNNLSVTPFPDTNAQSQRTLVQMTEAGLTALRTSLNSSITTSSPGYQQVMKLTTLALLQHLKHLTLQHQQQLASIPTQQHPLIACIEQKMFCGLLSPALAHSLIVSWMPQVLAQLRVVESSYQRSSYLQFDFNTFWYLCEADLSSVATMLNKTSVPRDTFLQCLIVVSFGIFANVDLSTTDEIHTHINTVSTLLAAQPDRGLQLAGAFAVLRSRLSSQVLSREVEGKVVTAQSTTDIIVSAASVVLSSSTSTQSIEQQVTVLFEEARRILTCDLASPTSQEPTSRLISILESLLLIADKCSSSSPSQLSTILSTTASVESYLSMITRLAGDSRLPMEVYLLLVRLHCLQRAVLRPLEPLSTQELIDILEQLPARTDDKTNNNSNGDDPKVHWKHDLRVFIALAEGVLQYSRTASLIAASSTASMDVVVDIKSLLSALLRDFEVELFDMDNALESSSAVSSTATPASTATAASTVSTTSTTAEAQLVRRKLIVTVLLTLSTHLPTLFTFQQSDGQQQLSIPFPLVDQCLQLLLELLRGSSGLLSDLCTSALHHLHRHCDPLPLATFSEVGQGLQKYRSVGAYIAQETLATITRRKRKAQPLGFDASSRGGGRTSATGATTDGDTQQQQGIPIPVDPNNPLGMGEDGVLRDALLDAASRMATQQFDVALDGVSANRSNSSNAAEALDVSENGYGAYQKLCQIARKTGDSAAVMMVLAQIRQDITLGESNTAAIYARYRPLVTVLDVSRALALVPALYMAKFDPIASIREIMTRIWRDLRVQTGFAAENELIAHVQREILHVLVANMLNPMWRERESAALALDTILLQRPWRVIAPFASELLQKAFKLVDDLRESTRKAALTFFKTLLHHIVRACDAHESGLEVAKETINTVVPILLEQGILSPAVEARGCSFGLLLRLIDQATGEQRMANASTTVASSSALNQNLNALFGNLNRELQQGRNGDAEGRDGNQSPSRRLTTGPTPHRRLIHSSTSLATKDVLLPWLDRLVDALVESIGALEPQMMSYLQFHSSSMYTNSGSGGNNNNTSGTNGSNGSNGANSRSSLQAQEDWERLRIELMSHSPLHDALRQCLRLLDPVLLPKVASTLFHQLKSGVGLPSRVAAADSVAYLAEQYPTLLSSGTGPQILQLLGGLLSEKPHLEVTLKKALYNAYGVLCKVVTLEALEEEGERLLLRAKQLMAVVSAPSSAGKTSRMSENTGSAANSHSSQLVNFTSSEEFVGALRDEAVETATVSCLRYLLQRAGDRLGSGRARLDSLWVPLLSLAFLGSQDIYTIAQNGGDESTTRPSTDAVTQASAALTHSWQDVLVLLLDVSGLGSRAAALQRSRAVLLSYATMWLLDLSWDRRQQALQLLIQEVLKKSSGATVSSTNTIKDATGIAQEAILCATLLVQLTYSGAQQPWRGQQGVLEALPLLLPRLLMHNKYQRTNQSDQSSERLVLQLLSSTPIPTIGTESSSSVSLSITQELLLVHKAEAVKDVQQQLRNLASSFASLANNSNHHSIQQMDGPGSTYEIYLHVHPLVSLLVQQTQRYGGAMGGGGLQDAYRLHAAKTLTLLPWAMLLEQMDSDHRHEILRELKGQAGLSLIAARGTEASAHGSVVDADQSTTSIVGDGGTSPSSNTTTSISSTTVSTAATSSVKKPSASMMMFGNRYGTSSTAERPRKVAKTTSSTSASSSSSSSATASAASGVSQNSNASTTNAASTVPTAVATAAKGITASPVFRSHLLQALALCYDRDVNSNSAKTVPGATTDFTAEEIAEGAETVEHICSWLRGGSAHHTPPVWSVKKALLQLLASLVHALPLSTPQLSQVLMAATQAWDEPKYVAVVVQALVCVQRAMTGVNRTRIVTVEASSVTSSTQEAPMMEVVDEERNVVATNTPTASESLLESVLRPALRRFTAQGDRRAEVLEAVSRLHHLLLL